MNQKKFKEAIYYDLFDDKRNILSIYPAQNERERFAGGHHSWQLRSNTYIFHKTAFLSEECHLIIRILEENWLQ